MRSILVLGFVLLSVAGCANTPETYSTFKLYQKSAQLDLSRSASAIAKTSNRLDVSSGISAKATLLNTDFKSLRRVERQIVYNKNRSSLDLPSVSLRAIAEKAAEDLYPGVEFHFAKADIGMRFAYVTFDQTYAGYPVVGARLVIRVTPSGDWLTASSTIVNPLLLQNLKFQPQEKMVSGRYFPKAHHILSERTVVYPRKNENGEMVFHAARELALFDLEDQLENSIWIDENSLEAIGAYNPASHFDQLHASGTVTSFTEGSQTIPGIFSNLTALLEDGTRVLADDAGTFNLASLTGKTAKIMLENSYLSVVNNAKADSKVNVDLARLTSTNLDINQGPSDEERNIYHYVMVARKYLHEKLHYDNLTYQMVAIANYGEHYDNAFFMPLMKTLNFGTGGSFFYNTAHSRDVILHEFGHAVTQEIYGTVPGFEFSAMNEAFSDYFAATITDEPRIGAGILIPSTHRDFLRNVDNTMVYPKDYTGTRFHDDGQIFSGSLWRFRKAVGAELADTMIHEARLAQAKTVGEFMQELLVVDKAGNLDWTVDTSHRREIMKSFESHGIYTDTLWAEKTENLTIPWKRSLGCLSFDADGDLVGSIHR